MEGSIRATIDMGRGSSNREITTKYIAYLHQQQRRLRQPVAAAPADDAAAQAGYLNGVKVARKGRGQPPASNKEVLWSTHGRKEVQGKSHAANPGILQFNPAATQPKTLTVDETRNRFMRKATNRFNQSSMSGCSMMVAEPEPAHRPCRAKGANSPGLNSDRMSKSLAHTGEPDEDSLKARKSLVWAVAALPDTTDNIIRHNQTAESGPAKLAMRPVTPAHRSVNLKDSRSAFLGSLSGYAQNKVRAHYGDYVVSSSGSLAALAGY